MQTHKTNYIAIFVWLIIFTVAEVGVVYLGLPKTTLALLLLATALAKAILVALYFMHLRFEMKLILGIVGGTVVLAAIFFVALFPDMVVAHSGG